GRPGASSGLPVPEKGAAAGKRKERYKVADTLVLDLETQKTFDDVGGRNRLYLMRVSLVGIFSYDKNAFRTYTEWEAPSLRGVLEEAGLVVGFNIKRFDYPVLEPYVKKSLRDIPTLDMMEDVQRHLGHRLSLDSLVKETLGEGKTGHGLDAIRFFREGRLEELKSYCLADVRLTRDLFEYGKQNGHIKYQKNGQSLSIPVNWKDRVPVSS
ncbi:MAG TPA: ribonuclease H-like domain-containing protein, partial [Nitrospiria bacterium]